MKNLSDKAKKFLERKPFKIATVAGVDFYEHPSKGDEVPMLAITNSGKLKSTEFWELPTFEDLLHESDLLEDVNYFKLK